MTKNLNREQKAILMGIVAHPNDDDARLVYADWLEEHGDNERAEFIHVQIELARLEEPDPFPPSVDSDCHARHELARRANSNPRHQELRAREKSLLYPATSDYPGSNYVRWAGRLPRWARQHIYRRGFVAHAKVTAPGFLKGSGALWRSTPISHEAVTCNSWAASWHFRPTNFRPCH